MSEIRALLFDTFGTLVDWRTGLVTQLEQWGRAQDIAADWAGLVLAWRRDHVPALAKVRTGQREWANYDELQAETMRQLAPKFGLPALSDDTLDHLAKMWHKLPAWRDTAEGMARLRARYLVAPLSNGHVALLMSLARGAGISFDTVFGADIFRQYKPDPKTYLGAVALLGCTPAEVLFVASHPSDLESAAGCGLHTCFVSRPLEYGAGVVVEQPPAKGDFDLMVGDLLELATVMENQALQHI
ncbi:haloacid dehalogenase type II [Mycobacterium sp.]|uniref:haloacid dehalogenase type II n=1 Tax=Mycobacterium sp. TaxID=1785 RepID=UPI002C33EA84|nr:haloacid dehalogenase type II [Mycobacterium sp.]HTQ23042.1 haloacid dehalogenase type II [Mycobacterium sp.]